MCQCHNPVTDDHGLLQAAGHAEFGGNVPVSREYLASLAYRFLVTPEIPGYDEHTRQALDLIPSQAGHFPEFGEEG